MERKRVLKIDYAGCLNLQQYKVVTEGDGPCLVLAGAGSGKTRTLIYRVAYLLERHVKPENILLVTFTNKAARGMLKGIEDLLGYQPAELWWGTFHHIGNLCLRRYAALLGFSEDFGILDREDSRSLVNSCIKELKINTAERRFPRAAVVEAIISLAANSKSSIAEIIRLRHPYFKEFIPELGKIRKTYIERKKSSNNMDYNDLLTKWIELLQTVEGARRRYCSQFQYILVDEYQDTNRLQSEIIQIIGSQHKNILVVGDDAQSIYSFRAADIKNILDFPAVFPDTKIFKLETNYRSSPEILGIANEAISNNINQYPKKLKNVQPKGELAKLIRLQDRRQEARFVSRRIIGLKNEGIAMNEIAVLFRAKYQVIDLELEFARQNIPYVIRGGVSFFEQAHIKDILAYLKIIANPKDELSWRRALQLCPGIGPNSVNKVWSKIVKAPNPLSAALAVNFKVNLSNKAQLEWKNFLKVLLSLNSTGKLSDPAGMIRAVLTGGYEQYIHLSFENAQERLEDLRQLVNFASRYDYLKNFLTDATLREGFKGEVEKGVKEKEEYVILSTVHQAKGLEWQVVIITGLSEGQFPHYKAVEDLGSLEEERRLFYVAITRAKQILYLVCPFITQPSIFIQELDSSCYEEYQEIEQLEEKIISDYTEDSRW